MRRKIRFEEGKFYHIFNRGNRKKRIFYGRYDYEKLERLIWKYTGVFDITVCEYCLMRNHFHLLVKQGNGGSVSDLMHRVGLCYAMYVNERYGFIGHLFQGRFKAKLIPVCDLKRVRSYIRTNPVKKGYVERWYDYRWSWGDRPGVHY